LIPYLLIVLPERLLMRLGVSDLTRYGTTAKRTAASQG
jgi:hypothetical protein